MDPAATADFSLVIETLYQVAADPAAWDQLIAVLEPDAAQAAPEPVAVGAVDRARDVARLAWTPGEGIGPQTGAVAEVGWVILGARRRVLAASPAAAAALEAGRGHAVPGRTLSFHDPANDEALESAVARWRARPEGQTILRLERGDEEGPCFAYLVAASALPAKAGLPPGAALASDEALALVFPAAESTTRLWTSIRDSFGLTQAEVRLARKLREGRSLKEAAGDLGVSVNTVRNQLAAVFGKMGLQRQSDLIRALTELSAVARTLEPPRPAARRLIAEAPPLRQMRLEDGRTLAYRSYGDPDGQAVLAFHEGMGSSLPPPDGEARARTLGLRMIIADRPGFGLSDPRDDYSFDAVAEDMVELLDRLEVGRVRLMGVLSGAPSALQTAVRLGDRAEFLLLCSARPPRPARSGAEGALAQMRARIEAHPWVLASFFAILQARLSPELTVRLMRRATAHSPGDRAYAEANPAAAAFIEAYVSECLAVSSRGAVDEIKAFRRSGNLTAAELRAPVAVWHGEDDGLSPLPDLLDFLGEAAREVRVIPDTGHLLALRYWDEVTERIAAPPPA